MLAHHPQSLAPNPGAPVMGKHQDARDFAGGSKPHRMAALAQITSLEILPFMNSTDKTAAGSAPGKKSSDEQAVVQPYPFFYYKDFSNEVDPDPLYPLVPPGRVPNFPAKMHAILSRPELEDIIAWMPHGRSWRVLKPREFELKVIPQYFDHAKYSSFVRQANGWGFRRISQGKDQGSYYHPKFLRNMPYLCKTMKRLVKTAKKRPADPNTEPDLFKISEMHPLPGKAQDETIMLNSTVQGGPNARVPVFDGARAFHNVMTANHAVASSYTAAPNMPGSPIQQTQPEYTHIAPKQVVSEPTSPATSHGFNCQPQPVAPTPMYLPPASHLSQLPPPPQQQQQPTEPEVKPSSYTANPIPFPFPMMAPFPMMLPPGAPAPGTDGAASFAAGFAAATAFSQQHFSNLLQCMAQANK